jgi:hypothetical protein
MKFGLGPLSAFANSSNISTTRWRWPGFAMSPLRSEWAMRGTVFPPSAVVQHQGWSRELKTALDVVAGDC